ncbi:hypothetical protein Q3G72_028858 [Acer saccharum]|nr:hypothetical protein Q3G72_028858 [Acer saccharum]
MITRQIGRNMEVYVDDMLTKSITVDKHVDDLRETFDVLVRYGMKLNPAKWVFGVPSGRFLGYQVHQRGIEVNPEKIQALAKMVSPKTLKDVQRLTGCLASLSSRLKIKLCAVTLRRGFSAAVCDSGVRATASQCRGSSAAVVQSRQSSHRATAIV